MANAVGASQFGDRPGSGAGVRVSERHTDGARPGLPLPRVLLVDDVDDNRDLYASYLAFAGFEVDQARDGEEALALIEKVRPGIIVMDLSMPRIDGWEATRLIKSNPRTKHIRVLVLTGHADRDHLMRARAAGADDVCTKPCLPQDLVERIHKLLGLGAREGA